MINPPVYESINGSKISSSASLSVGIKPTGYKISCISSGGVGFGAAPSSTSAG